MSTPANLLTERLELVPATDRLARLDCEDPAALERALEAHLPREGWPPGEYDRAAQAWLANMLERAPDQVGWWSWFWVRRSDRRVVGAGGFKGPPGDSGEVEVGYSVVQAEEGQGYATEATGALIRWAFTQPGVSAVAAETFPSNAGSLRVMEKNGLVYDRPGLEHGAVRYRRVKG